jgi:DNA adenine methylase
LITLNQFNTLAFNYIPKLHAILTKKNKIEKPFLRWAGGKTWLIKHLTNFLPKDGFNNYHEPFLGGGSIFLYLQPEKAFLSDLNKELIDTYKQVKFNVENVINELYLFENTETCYYKVRNEEYENEVKKAARFIFLNQTSFNGIYRVNLKGEYNVPFGYRNIKFFDPENLRSISRILETAELYHSDFNNTLQNIQENDLVFLDPPYTVTHNNNGFIKYNKKLFDLDSQFALSRYIDQLKERGAYYILTNAAHEEVEKIFTKGEDPILEMNRASLIGGKNAKRGSYAELIITNVIS